MSDPIVILFLCTGNSCRSQMAEGFAKHYSRVFGANVEIHSAGIEAHGLNPRAVKVMEEAEISIAYQTSDIITLSLLARTDLVITLCGHANENCPTLPPRVKKLHWGFDDPAKASGTEEQIMMKFYEIRDLIDIKTKHFIREVASLSKEDLITF